VFWHEEFIGQSRVKDSFGQGAMRVSRLAIIAFIVVVGAGSLACQRFSKSSERRYEMKGKVVAVDKTAGKVTIAHKEIAGYMGAMVMPFTMKDNWALGVLVPGDEVQATLVVDGASSWLEDPIITSESTETPGTDKTEGLRDPQPGDEVPDFALVNQDGKRIHLREYRGKVLLLTFIYTRCPLPDYCTLMSSNFAELNKELAKDSGLYSQTHLLSVSFDPDYDTPKVLKSYGSAYTEKYTEETFDHWEFVTGTKIEVKNVAEFFGLRYWRETDQIIHSLRTVIITPDGKVLKVYRGNEWKPAEILGDIRSMKLN
jgi:protein SCO1/2